MSGHVRFGFAALLVVAGYSTPAASNSFTDFFSPNPAPEAATAAPAPAPEECLRQPGPASSGGHWVYRYDGHRKCWFQAEEGPAVAKKPVRHHVASRRVAAPEQDKPAPRKQKDVEDARAERVNAAPAETPQPTPPEPTVKMVHTVPVRVADAAALIPPAPVPASPGVDQLTPDQPNSDQSGPRRVDVEQLLADSSAASEEVASAAAATPIAGPGATTGDDEEGTASWLGVLLMALGAAALLASSRTLRRALWPLRIPGSGTELPATAQSGRSDPSFASARIRFAGAGPDEVLELDPQSVAPLVHAVPTRRTVAPQPPSQEAFWEEGIGALAALTSPVSPEVFSRRRAMACREVEQRGSSSGS